MSTPVSTPTIALPAPDLGRAPVARRRVATLLYAILLPVAVVALALILRGDKYVIYWPASRILFQSLDGLASSLAVEFASWAGINASLRGTCIALETDSGVHIDLTEFVNHNSLLWPALTGTILLACVAAAFTWPFGWGRRIAILVITTLTAFPLVFLATALRRAVLIYMLYNTSYTHLGDPDFLHGLTALFACVFAVFLWLSIKWVFVTDPPEVPSPVPSQLLPRPPLYWATLVLLVLTIPFLGLVAIAMAVADAPGTLLRLVRLLLAIVGLLATITCMTFIRRRPRALTAARFTLFSILLVPEVGTFLAPIFLIATVVLHDRHSELLTGRPADPADLTLVTRRLARPFTPILWTLAAVACVGTGLRLLVVLSLFGVFGLRYYGLTGIATLPVILPCAGLAAVLAIWQFWAHREYPFRIFSLIPAAALLPAVLALCLWPLLLYLDHTTRIPRMPPHTHAYPEDLLRDPSTAPTTAPFPVAP